MRLLNILQLEQLTSAQIAALATGTGRYPGGSVVYDTTLNKIRVNLGSDAAPFWSGGVNQQTANYIALLADAEGLVEILNAGANTFTISPDATTTFPIGTSIMVAQTGAGQTTLTPGAGVTINSAGAALKIAGQWGVATVRKRAANLWHAFGNLTP